jgi:hypothetical protein
MIRPARPALLALLALLSAPAPASAQADAAAGPALTTTAERSGFRITGRYGEVVALCDAFARAHPEEVRCFDFGTTPEGRPMKALAVSRTGALTAEAARARGIPVTLVQGGIHAGEIDGKDAGFLALRELLEGAAAPGALDAQVLLFVPVFNVDGHERFGRWNRPNQRGPEEMGWRTTAQNYNLNRDYLKADAPEMQAMLALVEAWDPILYVDLHATNGAQFEHDVSIQLEPLYSGDDALRDAGRGLRDGVIADLAAEGSLPLPFYPSFVVDDDPSSGFVDGVSPPRFSTGYFPLRNRFAMLVETHSWKEYPVRVRITRNTIVSVLERVARDGREWLRLAADADARAARLGGQPVPLAYRATEYVRTIDFRGYAYTRTPSDVSGALMTRYDEATPQVWRVPVRDEIVPDEQVEAPRGGYLVPASLASIVAAKLDQHGIAFRTLDAALAQAEVEAFRADTTDFADRPSEGHQRATFEGRWAPERRDIGTGALFVPIAQPKARMVVALLEPRAPDSLAAWGRFNNHFERKEYMEAYVAEDVARAMLADEPALRAEFERRLREDPAFAADPDARLDFFYRRHSAWDERHGLYPVLRISRVP